MITEVSNFLTPEYMGAVKCVISACFGGGDALNKTSSSSNSTEVARKQKAEEVALCTASLQCPNRGKAGLMPLADIQVNQWRQIQPGGDAQCTDGPFSFMVRRGSSPNVVISFMGGGACWNAKDCIERSSSWSIPSEIAQMDCMSGSVCDNAYVYV
jgi:hypothetical protein